MIARGGGGPTWSYLGLEAEVPRPGDFQTCFVGDTPILLSRDEAGVLHALVNRCVHRGTIVRRETCGTASSHVCCYHQWSYNLKGELTGVPFRNGVKGRGGLPESFDVSCARLEPCAWRSIAG